MFTVNEDMSIYVTRGDKAFLRVTVDNADGSKYMFQPGDIVRFKVTEKKACENVMFYKDFLVEIESTFVDIVLIEKDTKIGDVISKPTDYWYEIELNPFTDPQTVVGYDEDGAKIFKLFPEGNDVESAPVDPGDIPIVDKELDETSTRPVQNQAIARGIATVNRLISGVENKYNELKEELTTSKKSWSDGKRMIVDAITFHNIQATIDMKIEELATKIKNIKKASGDAFPNHVLEGKTFTNYSGEILEGTMPDISQTNGAIRLEVEKDMETDEPSVLACVIKYGYYQPDFGEDEAVVGYPIEEVNEVTGFTDYKNAVVDGLANSGLGVTEETSADELQGILEGKFPAAQNILAHLLADEGYSQSSEHFDGSVTKGDTLNIFCSSDSQNRQDNCYIKLKGKDKYSMSSCLLSFNVEYNKGKEEGAGVDGDLNYAIIRVCNDTGEIAKWEKVGIIDVGTFADTLSFTSGGEWWVEIEVSSGSDYTNAIFNINSMVVEASADATDISVITDKLNHYTGETGKMTIEEIANKIDGILGEVTANKTRARGLYFYCKTLTEVKNPLDLSGIEDASQLFQGCSNLTYVATLHTEDAKDLSNAFNGCSSLVTIEGVNFSSVTTVSNTFKNCGELVNITFTGSIPISLDFSASSKLSPDSVDSIADAVVDLTGKVAQTVTFHTDTIITASQRARMTGKNWSVAGGKEG